MLMECTIKNLAVIEAATVRFGRGFHVLTGETGAGKSMIIDALSLIVGGRGSQELVRHGSERAEIECLFDVEPNHPVWQALEQLGIEASPDEHLVIRREITAQGKSTARINGQLVNLTMLRQAGEWLVNIHGQHEHQSLLKTERHIELLDAYARDEIREAYQAYRIAYQEYKQFSKQYRELKDKAQTNLHTADLYRFQIEEIDSARLKSGEDTLLNEEKNKLANAEKLFQSVSDSYEALYGTKAAFEWIGKAVHRLEAVADVDSAMLQPLLEQVRSAYYQVEDAAFQLRDYKESIEFNPGRLEQIEKRLDTIHGLKRKYGDSVDRILAYGEEIKRELQLLDDKDAILEQLQKERDKRQAEMERLAGRLTDIRKSSAGRLAGMIEEQLRELQMEKARVQVRIETSDGYGPSGVDQVEFLFTANPGEPPKPLSKIASGGELSRVMLALKSIFSSMERIPVLVFDEVDTGVSGRAAQAIAEKLARLAANCQVFSITHLPQVACMADAHYLIQKQVTEDRTYTVVLHMNADQQAEELARMLGGVEITSTTLHHAQEMLDLAREKKQQWHHLQ